MNLFQQLYSLSEVITYYEMSVRARKQLEEIDCDYNYLEAGVSQKSLTLLTQDINWLKL